MPGAARVVVVAREIFRRLPVGGRCRDALFNILMKDTSSVSDSMLSTTKKKGVGRVGVKIIKNVYF